MARNFVNGLVASGVGGATGTVNFGGFAAVVRTGSGTGNYTPLALTNDFNAAIKFDLPSASSVRFTNFQGSVTAPTITASVSDGWVFIAAFKATGTVAPRFHKYSYATDTWVHENGATTLANANAGSMAQVVLGAQYYQAVSNWYDGDIAAAALYSGKTLTDSQIESMPHCLDAWLATVPTGMWVLDQASTSQNVLDWMGRGANQTSITATSVTADSPPISYGQPVIVVAGHTASGGGSQSGAAALSAASSLTAGASVVVGGACAMSAASSLTAAAVPDRPGATTMSAASGLAADATRTVAGGASLTAQSGLSAAGQATIGAAAAMSAASSLTAVAVRTVTPAVALSSATSLTAGATATVGAGVQLQAASGLTADAGGTQSGAAALTAASSLAAGAVRQQPAAVGLTAASSLTATGTAGMSASVALSAASGLTAGGTALTASAVTLTALSQLAAGPSATLGAQALLSAVSGLTATVTAPAVARTPGLLLPGIRRSTPATGGSFRGLRAGSLRGPTTT